MNDKHVAMLGFITGFIIVGVICISGIFLYDAYSIDINYNITYDDYIHNNFTYMQHYVKFHIYPEQEGINVVAWATDEFPPTTGYTDNNSEVVFPMISSAKYNILIDNNICSYYIYPVESYYKITCGG